MRWYPEMRAEWQRAADATRRIDGMDLRHLSEAQLLTRVTSFERETAWARPARRTRARRGLPRR